jgi:hypothetical protein
MKYVLILFIAMNGLLAAEPEGLTKIKDKYKAGLEKLFNDLDEVEVKNAVETLEKLKGLDKKLQTSGELKKLVSLRKLLKDLKPEDVVKLPKTIEEVNELLNVLSMKNAKVFKEYSTALKKYQTSYQAALKRKVKFYTQKNEIETALAFQVEIDNSNGAILEVL